MTVFIVHLRLQDVGCHINHKYIGCFLYADDIILISPLIIGLQQMLVVRLATTMLFAFKLNYNKSHCLSFGNFANGNLAVDIDPMLFDNHSRSWFLIAA